MNASADIADGQIAWFTRFAPSSTICESDTRGNEGTVRCSGPGGRKGALALSDDVACRLPARLDVTSSSPALATLAPPCRWLFSQPNQGIDMPDLYPIMKGRAFRLAQMMYSSDDSYRGFIATAIIPIIHYFSRNCQQSFQPKSIDKSCFTAWRVNMPGLGGCMF
jgi:hypothetical protein